MAVLATLRSPRKKAAVHATGGLGPTPVSYTVLILLALIAALPLLVLVFNSFKTSLEIGTNPLGPPSELDFANFAEAWERGNMAQGFRNSAIIVAGTILGTWLCAGSAAYALARLNLPFKRGIETYLFLVISLPVQMFIVPLFFLWVQLGLMNTLLGLIIIYVALNTPFSVLLLRTFLVGIPRELDEAARLDGANEWQVATRIIMPIGWPGFLTVGLVSGLGAYGELLFAVNFLVDPELMPISTSFLQFSQGFTQLYNLVNAASVIIVIPLIILFLFMQRRFIAGLATGGTKG
ncbi:carbohydrate ABC transporter permease [Herbiconiux moechotypicola]|uniref:Carbohydrate ABC transporter permease n=1 Tax=Herbiconiux moechotypicola TaxID=637393 RepID=A0ABN3DPK8_9MICO|nr:carbohydrate ABC transporter permease [Herbiconiux moechotypicola]MCS5731661.1 carbohydrate ABC transporter permease [Herbiconiux moechotypicola]